MLTDRRPRRPAPPSRLLIRCSSTNRQDAVGPMPAVAGPERDPGRGDRGRRRGDSTLPQPQVVEA